MNRIEKAADIFLDAVNAGTLAKGTCAACAVSNLVAHGMGIEIKKEDISRLFSGVPRYGMWGHNFQTNSRGFQSISSSDKHISEVLECVDATDFTLEELRKIENTFERSSKINFLNYPLHTSQEIREDQIRGLEAVLNLMMTFENEKEQDVKEIFTNKLEPVLN